MVSRKNTKAIKLILINLRPKYIASNLQTLKKLQNKSLARYVNREQMYVGETFHDTALPVVLSAGGRNQGSQHRFSAINEI